MNFFKKIRDSIYSPAFYSEVPQKSLGSAIGYFFLLVLFLTILQSIVPIWTFLTAGQTAINQFVNQTKNTYPSELVIKIQKGKVSTNVREPYFIPIPFPKDIKQEIDKENLAVIDTQTTFSVNQFSEYKTYLWLTEDSVFIENNGKIQANGLSKISDTTINRALVDSLINKVLPWLKIINPIVIIGILLGIYLAYSCRLIYLFILALIIWLLAKAFKKKLTYGGSYKIGLYAMTLGFIVDIVFGWIHFSGFIFMFTLISLGATYFNFLQTPKETPIKLPNEA